MTSVEKIHSRGESFFSFPFKVYCLPNGGESRMLVISVPKRLFRRAVKRNLIRRRIREAFRLNEGDFPVAADRHILMVYTHSSVLEYDRICESVKSVLGKIR